MQELVETIEGIVGFLKLNLLVMKSLDVMKSNYELGFQSKNKSHISSVYRYDSEQGFTH